MASLAETRGARRRLRDELAAHRKQCRACSGAPRGPRAARIVCPEGDTLRAAIETHTAMLAHWFDPGPDQGTLAGL